MLSDQHYRWVVVLYSIVLQAVNIGVLTYCFALFSLPWIDEFGASRRDVMITISCMQIGVGVMSPTIGRLMDRFPMRNIVLLGGVLMALGLWLAQYVTALWQLWLIYATIMPLSSALMGTLAAQTLVAKWFNTQRGLALGLSAMGTNVGGVIFPTLVAVLLVDFGWRTTFVYLAVVCLLLVVPLTLFVLRREPGRLSPDAQAQDLSVQGQQSSVEGKLWSTKEILTTSLFWLPFLSLIPLNMGFGAVQFNLGGIVRDIGLGDDVTAILITVSAIGMVVGKLFFGGFADRIDHRGLFWVATGVMCIGLALLLVVESYAGLIVVMLCMGLSGGGILPLMGIIFGARFGAASFGRVMGFVMLSIMVGAISPVMAGWVYDSTGSYDWAFYALIAVAIPAAFAMYRLPKPLAG